MTTRFIDRDHAEMVTGRIREDDRPLVLDRRTLTGDALRPRRFPTGNQG